MSNYSTIICPHCNHAREEIMMTHACTLRYECESCKTVLVPKEGECCVFCSYGTADCNQTQKVKKCCVPNQD